MFRKVLLMTTALFGLVLVFSAVPIHAQCSPDTIVCREEPPVPGNGNEDPVPVELVQLCLVSAEPIVVSINQDCEDFDGFIKLHIDLDETTPPRADRSPFLRDPFLLEIEDVFTIQGRGTIPSRGR